MNDVSTRQLHHLFLGWVEISRPDMKGVVEKASTVNFVTDDFGAEISCWQGLEPQLPELFDLLGCGYSPD